MQQLSSLLTPSKLLTAITGRDSKKDSAVIGMQSLNFGSQAALFTVCRDGKLRVWDLITQQCIKTLSLYKSNALLGTACGHFIRIFDCKPLEATAYGGQQLSFQLIVYLDTLVSRPDFVLIKGTIDINGQISMEISDRVSSEMGPEVQFVDFSVIPVTPTSTEFICWSLWDDQLIPISMQFEISASRTRKRRWLPVALSPNEPAHLNILDEGNSIDQVYLDHLLSHGRFPLSIFQRLIPELQNAKEDADLRLAIQKHVSQLSMHVPGNAGYFEGHYEYLMKSWAGFLTNVVQLHTTDMAPSRIIYDANLNQVKLHRRGGVIGSIRAADFSELMLESYIPFLSILPQKLLGQNISRQFVDSILALTELEAFFKKDVGGDQLIENLHTENLLPPQIDTLELSSDFLEMISESLESGDKLQIFAGLFGQLGDPNVFIQSLVNALDSGELKSSFSAELGGAGYSSQLYTSALYKIISSRYSLLMAAQSSIIVMNRYSIRPDWDLQLLKQFNDYVRLYARLFWLQGQPFRTVSNKNLENRFAMQNIETQAFSSGYLLRLLLCFRTYVSLANASCFLHTCIL